MYQPISLRTTRIGTAALGVLAAMSIVAAACGGTSSADKTSTAAAKGGKTPASTIVATKPATTSTAATGTTPAASGSPTAAAAAGTTTLKITTDPTLGRFFTDSKGFSLYIFKADVAGNGKSAAETLAAVWPPITADAPPAKPEGATGDFAIITRGDGKKQVTYKGLPLYYFVNDKAAGDTKGQGVGNVWFVAAP